MVAALIAKTDRQVLAERPRVRYAAANTAFRIAAGNVIVRKSTLGYR
jgi:hypothetical protein